MPKRSSKRKAQAVVDDDEEESGGEAYASPSQKSQALVDSEVDDDDDPVETMGFSSQAPELSQDIDPVKPSDRNNLLKLSDTARSKAISDLTRMILFTALAGDAIDKKSVLKEAGVTDNRIASAAFDQANLRLANLFGLELKRIPLWMTRVKSLPARCKTRYYLVNCLQEEEEEEAGEHSKALHSIHDMAAVEKGLLMVVLALCYCKGEPRTDGSRWIADSDLYFLLHRLDENIPAEPPSVGSKRATASQMTQSSSTTGGVALTPDVDATVEKMVRRDYLIKEKATEDQVQNGAAEGSFYYMMGPRAVLEVGRRQVIYFCAEILEEEPDPTMLVELEQDQEMEEDE